VTSNLDDFPAETLQPLRNRGEDPDDFVPGQQDAVAERIPAEDLSDVPVNPDNQVVMPEFQRQTCSLPADDRHCARQYGHPGGTRGK
jgi:hypothetical protein